MRTSLPGRVGVAPYLAVTMVVLPCGIRRALHAQTTPIFPINSLGPNS
jgi:hypothetical protein